MFENRNQARMAIFDYIEGFYNTWRRHSSIGNVCPVAFETTYRARDDAHRNSPESLTEIPQLSSRSR